MGRKLSKKENAKRAARLSPEEREARAGQRVMADETRRIALEAERVRQAAEWALTEETRRIARLARVAMRRELAEEMRRTAVEEERARVASERELAERTRRTELADRVAREQALAEEARQAEYDARLKPYRELVSAAVDAYVLSLPAAGTELDVAIDAVIAASGMDRATASPHRDTFLSLSRRFIRPTEQIVGVYAHAELRGDRLSYPVLVVAFSDGFAVKHRSTRFRSERDAAWVRLGEAVDGAGLYHFEASAQFGDEICRTRSAGIHAESTHLGMTYPQQEPLTDLYLALAAQQRIVASPRETPVGGLQLPKPAPRLIRSARDAELAAADWMGYLGFTNVRVSPIGADGGVDVLSEEAVAQVKAEVVATGQPKVQQLQGAAASVGKQAFFFALAGYTLPARVYADSNGIALFSFDLQGEPEPANFVAHELMEQAIPSSPSR
jgi:hypothetical protein